MIPNSKIENVDYELIPSEDKSDGWNIRILNGQFSDTVIEFGAVRFNEIEDNMSFSFEVISSPDPDITTQNIDFPCFVFGQMIFNVTLGLSKTILGPPWNLKG